MFIKIHESYKYSINLDDFWYQRRDNRLFCCS